MPQTKTYHVSEFANLIPSYMGYARSEVTSVGNVWINMDRNIYSGLPLYDDTVRNVLCG